MREWTNIEKQMKTVVNAHESQAPDFIWSAIEEELHTSKRTSKYFLYAVGLLLSLILAGIVFSNFSSRGTSSTEVQQMLVDPKMTAEVETQKEQPAEPVFTTLPVIAEESEEDHSNRRKASKKSDRKTVIQNMQSVEASIKSIDKATVSPEGPILKSLATQTNNATSLASSGIVNSKNTRASTPNIGAKSRAITQVNPLLHTANFIGLIGEEREVLQWTDGIECPTFSKSISIEPFIEINGMLGLHNKSLETFLMEEEFEATELLAAREDSESEWYNWGGQFHVGLNVNHNLYFGTGLEWSQAKDKFKYEDEGITKIVIDLDPDGNPIDTSLVSGMFISTGEVRYNMLDIPVFAGISKSMGSWNLGIEAAALINLSFSAEGKIVNQELDIKRADNGTKVYKDGISLGLRGSIVLRRYLSDGFSFHIKPSYKTYLADINQDAYPLKTRLGMTRLEMGFRKDF